METLGRSARKRVNHKFGVCYRHLSRLVIGYGSSPLSPAQTERASVSTNATQIAKLHSFLQLCAKTREPINGKACHARTMYLGLKADILTSNMLINMYSKCGLIGEARQVFDKMPQRSLVSWNTMIGTYTQNGEEQEALTLFLAMQREGNLFSEFTVSSVICACAAKSGVSECRQLHAFAIKARVGENVFVGTALIDVYAKSGLIDDASRVFEEMAERTDVTWSSMVAGYVQNELYEEALVCFIRGQETGLVHNKFTMSSVTCACAGLAALIPGKLVHVLACKAGFGTNNFVASSLVDMYAKCGSIKEAYDVFSDIQEKNIVLWNVMISGFAKHSCSLEVMILFEKMQQTGLNPDAVTYVSVLSACSHTGLVEKGRSYFDLMITEHKVQANVFHYSCMVDILGRAGRILEAYELIKTMPFSATAAMWGSLLASCRTRGNLELAEVAAEKLFEMELDNAGNYVLLSNTYAANNKWKEAAIARKSLKENEMKKEKGKSWIEIKYRVHTFMSGERNHPRTEDVYQELDRLLEEMKEQGYKAQNVHELYYAEERNQTDLFR